MVLWRLHEKITCFLWRHGHQSNLGQDEPFPALIKEQRHGSCTHPVQEGWENSLQPLPCSSVWCTHKLVLFSFTHKVIIFRWIKWYKASTSSSVVLLWWQMAQPYFCHFYFCGGKKQPKNLNAKTGAEHMVSMVWEKDHFLPSHCLFGLLISIQTICSMQVTGEGKHLEKPHHSNSQNLFFDGVYTSWLSYNDTILKTTLGFDISLNSENQI